MYVTLLWIALYLLIGLGLVDRMLAMADKANDPRAKDPATRQVATVMVAVIWPVFVLGFAWDLIRLLFRKIF